MFLSNDFFFSGKWEVRKMEEQEAGRRFKENGEVLCSQLWGKEK